MSWRQVHLRGGLTFTQQPRSLLISRVMVWAAAGNDGRRRSLVLVWGVRDDGGNQD